MQRTGKLLLFCALLCGGAPHAIAATAPATSVVLITGANRGIGLALTQGYVAKGWQVIATCRDPVHADDLKALALTHPQVMIESLDVTNIAAIDALADKYRGRPIDVLINNAGVLGDNDAQVLKNFDVQTFDEVLRVNSYAPLRVSAAFLDSVALSRRKEIISLTSFAGSIGAVKQGHDHYFYHMSKSALNMGMRLLQNDVRDRGVIVGLISPGPVDTDMNRQYRRGAAPGSGLRSPAQSATAVIALIERLTPDMGGRFYEYTGDEVPW